MTNVLLVVADDMRSDLAPLLPFVSGIMKSQGTNYPNMRCSTPLCSPARAALMSGQYAQGLENGVYTNDVSDITNPNNSIAKWLNDAGVYTGFFGKYTKPGQSTAPTGWDEWACMSGGTQSAFGYVLKDKTGATITPSPPIHQLEALESLVNTFITTAAQPFFCYFAPTNPHIDTATLLNNPSAASADRFNWKKWDFVKLTDGYLAAKPSWISSRTQITDAGFDQLQSQIRAQIRESFDVDQVVSRLHASLSSAGRLADTVIMFVSDSGVFYGEQRIWGGWTSAKDWPYDPCAKAPGYIMGPGFAPGNTVMSPVMLQDITATVADIFNATPGHAIDGVSLLETVPLTRAHLYERGEGDAGSMPDAQGIVTLTRKLIRYPGESGDDMYEMYDLDTDADEFINVANLGPRLTERNALEAQLDTMLLVKAPTPTHLYGSADTAGGTSKISDASNTWARTASTTTITVTTTTAHNLSVGSTVVVRSTSDATALPNGSYTVQTVPSTTTYTLTGLTGVATNGTSIATLFVKGTAGHTVIIDAYASHATADVNDLTISGACLKSVTLVDSDQTIFPAATVRRRLLRFKAIATGYASAVTVTTGSSQTVDSLGLALRSYPWGNLVKQTVKTSFSNASLQTAHTATLAAFSNSANTADYVILKNGQFTSTPEAGAASLFDGTHATPGIGFASLWKTNDTTPSATSATGSTTVSFIASEIGI